MSQYLEVLIACRCQHQCGVLVQGHSPFRQPGSYGCHRAAERAGLGCVDINCERGEAKAVPDLELGQALRAFFAADLDAAADLAAQ